MSTIYIRDAEWVPSATDDVGFDKTAHPTTQKDILYVGGLSIKLTREQSKDLLGDLLDALGLDCVNEKGGE